METLASIVLPLIVLGMVWAIGRQKRKEIQNSVGYLGAAILLFAFAMALEDTTLLLWSLASAAVWIYKR